MALKTSKLYVFSLSEWISRLTFLHVLFLLGQVTADAQVTDITLHEARGEIQSRCQIGLKAGVDRFYFAGNVFGLPSNNMAIFQIRENDSYPWRLMCAFNIEQCSNPMTDTCFCRSLSSSKYARVSMTANPALQGSSVRLIAGTQASPPRKVPMILETEVETLTSGYGKITFNSDTDCDIGVSSTGATYIEYCVRRIVGKYSVKVEAASGKQRWNLETDSLPCVGTYIQLLNARPSVETAVPVTLSSKITLSFSVQNCGTDTKRTCTISDSSSVVVHLDPFDRRDSSTVCEVEGVPEGAYFFFKGMVNTKGVDTQQRKTIFIVQIGKSGRHYKTIDSIKEMCGPNAEPNQAYCLEKIGNVYDIRINLTATRELSRKSIRLLWPKTSEDPYDSSESQAIPLIHKRFTTTLQVNNGKKIKLNEGPAPWDFKMSKFEISVLKFCVNNPTDSYRVSASIDGKTVESAFSQPCITINHTPSCYDFQKTFGFMYAETENCYRTGIYENKGLVPYLEANQTVLDPESHDCYFQWRIGSTEAVIKFCTYNLARPYMLTATLLGHQLNSTTSSCLTIRNIPRSGGLEFKVESQCLIEPSYVCRVHLIDNFGIEAQISADHEAFSVINESCNIVLNQRHNTSMLFCIYVLKPPYTVSMTLHGTGVEQKILVETEDCVSFHYKADHETTDIFSIQDAEKKSRVYRCSVKFYPDKSRSSNEAPDICVFSFGLKSLLKAECNIMSLFLLSIQGIVRKLKGQPCPALVCLSNDLRFSFLYGLAGIFFFLSGFVGICCYLLATRKHKKEPFSTMKDGDNEIAGKEKVELKVQVSEPQSRRISLERTSYSSSGTSVDVSTANSTESLASIR